MIIDKLKSTLSLKVVAGEEGLKNSINGCYVGDLLSWTLGHAQPGNLLVTVVGSINTIAVCSLVGIPCIVLTESAALYEDAKEKADELEIVVLSTDESCYEFVKRFSNVFSS